jgi:hypothetical protein
MGGKRDEWKADYFETRIQKGVKAGQMEKERVTTKENRTVGSIRDEAKAEKWVAQKDRRWDTDIAVKKEN